MRLSCRFFSLLRMAFLLLLLGIPCSASWGQTSSQQSAQLPTKWNDAVRSLAEKIAAAAAPSHAIALQVKNTSTLSAADVGKLRETLEAELSSRHVHTSPADSGAPDSAVPVHATFSEGAEGFVWIAEIGRGEGKVIAIVPAPKLKEQHASDRKPSLTLLRNIVQRQSEMIVDFEKKDILGGTASSVRVLDLAWTLAHSAFVSDTMALSGSARLSEIYAARDPRGRFLRTKGGQLQTFIPGLFCVGTWIGISGFDCGPGSEQAWPVGDGLESPYAANRNYFVGFVNDENGWLVNKPPFFSAATYPLDHSTFRILAELDGKARLYEDTATPAATFSGWGDDIVSIKTACDKTWKVIVTGTGDWTQPDHIQIYEITEHQAVAIGQPLDFPGPITAMWPSDDGKSARVISRNLQTGMYEASIVFVSCSD
jgi:hypothetical protein